MQIENNIPRFQELNEVLRDAQFRRSADLGGWLKQYFETRRQARLQTQAPAGADRGGIDASSPISLSGAKLIASS